MEQKDLPLFQKWLATPHVKKWYHDPEDWIEEITSKEFCWVHHFIAEQEGVPVGFCQYYDYKDSDEQWGNDIATAGTYSIDYLIGEPEYLRHGVGKHIVAALLEQVLRHEDARQIIVQPEPENAASCGLLRACGFTLADVENNIYQKVL
ncbi:MAG: GNAT family N-acetyltransferase [Eubacteriales bacterium]|nr:GNAT family N-acetyltransferase [Eubacteriales bacterium]